MRCIALVLAVLLGMSATPASADFYSLLTAARLDDLGTVRTLLAAGDDPNPFAPGDGYSPLQFAAQHDDAEMVRLLLAAGADPEYRDHNGERALLWAADEGALVSMSLLLAAGSPPNSGEDPYGETPLMKAATSHNTAAVVLLLAAGADLAARDQSSLTALHYAAWQGDAATVRLLLAEGANPNTITETLHETPLHYAASDAEMVKALLDAGIAADAQNHDGWTALYRAVQIGEVEAVGALLAGYARPDVANHAGVTPLMVAAEQGHVEIARLLLEHGASKTALDDNGHDAEYYLSHEAAMPGLEPKVAFDVTDIQTPRNHVIYRPVDPEEIARLRANHEAIRKLLQAD